MKYSLNGILRGSNEKSCISLHFSACALRVNFQSFANFSYKRSELGLYARPYVAHRFSIEEEMCFDL